MAWELLYKCQLNDIVSFKKDGKITRGSITALERDLTEPKERHYHIDDEIIINEKEVI